MKVVVYTTPACPYCVLVKNFLKKNNISFDEIDISKDEKKKEELIKKSGYMRVPVTEIDGIIIVGYDLKKIKEALKIE
jgi:glutaredoxin-like YruB-family protein